METSTLLALLNDQKALIASAALALPHKFETCTYNLGSIRQAVYLCITCNEIRGLCQSCSVSCHGEHEQIELFPKRGFRCDCPTKALPGVPCKITEGGTGEKLEINLDNTYNQNYKDGGRFCRCHSLYDAERERETMVQCLACEDWFHESCLNLRERIQPRSIAPTPDRESSAPSEGVPAADLPSVTEILDNQPERYWDYANDDDEGQDPDIPPALIPAAEYDVFICGDCVLGSAMLRKWAGTPGVKMVVREQGDAKWRVLEDKDASKDVITAGESSQVDVPDAQTSPKVGEKRSRDHLEGDDTKDDVPATKKPRLEEGSTKPCACPTPNAQAQQILDRLEGKSLAGTSDQPTLQGTGDIFLTHGWRDRWCRCSSCLFSLMGRPYLDQEEETYEPPQDPDAGLSLEELGMRALENLPREQALDGIRAFQTMSAELRAYLVPFAESGKVVTVDVIRDFFEARKREQNANR